MAADSFPQPGAARGHEFWLVEALLGLALVASAISLTTFLRRPEYLAATGAARPRSAGDYGDGFAAEQKPERSASLVGLVEDLGRFLIHYNILASLMYAADEFSSGFYFSYCDIVIAPSAVARLATAARKPAAGSLAASLVIDRRWADAYAGRTLHPVSEAELTLIEFAAPAQ